MFIMLNLLGTMFYRFNIFSILFAVPKEVYSFLFLHFAERPTFVIFDFDFV